MGTLKINNCKLCGKDSAILWKYKHSPIKWCECEECKVRGPRTHTQFGAILFWNIGLLFEVEDR